MTFDSLDNPDLSVILDFSVTKYNVIIFFFLNKSQRKRHKEQYTLYIFHDILHIRVIKYMTNYRECLKVNSKNVIKTLEIYEHWISILPHFSTEQLVQIHPILGSFLPPMILFWFGLVVQKPSSK